MNEEVFKEYVNKFQEGYIDNGQEVATDTEILQSVVKVDTEQQTEIITGSIDNLKLTINDLYNQVRCIFNLFISCCISKQISLE